MDIANEITYEKQNTKIKQAIFAENLSSVEYYYDESKDDLPSQVLKDVSFTMNQGEICCVLSQKTYEIKLLLDIISSTKPYQGGRCILRERGMMRKKQYVVEDIFYIASTNMLYDNMTVLEYLTLVTSETDVPSAKRQLEILDYLCELGLEYISLTHILYLTPAEKTIVLLLTAMYAKSPIVMVNLPRITYNTKEIDIFFKICNQLKSADTCLILSTHDYNLANQISDKVVILEDGVAREFCSRSKFVENYDKLKYTLTFETDVQIPIYDLLSNTNAVQRGNKLFIYESIELFKIIELLESHNVHVIKTEENKPNVGNAVNALLGGECHV